MRIDDLQRRIRGHATGPRREPLPGETRTLRLLDRRGDPTAVPRPVTVLVSAACPACGAARGEPTEMTIVDAWTETEHVISAWRNSCGHVDLHADVIEEAERFRMERTA